MSPGEIAGLIVASSAIFTGLAALFAKWLEQRASEHKVHADEALEAAKLGNLTVEAATEMLERHAKRLEEAYERERERRETLEADVRKLQAENADLSAKVAALTANLSDLPNRIRRLCPADPEKCPFRKLP